MHPLPTLYALHAMIRAHKRVRKYQEQIVRSAEWCLSALHETDAFDPFSRAYKYLLCYALAEYESIRDGQASYREAIRKVLSSDGLKYIQVTENVRFEYRIQDEGSESHAFCVLYAGLLQAWVELWSQSRRLDVKLEEERTTRRATELFDAIYAMEGLRLHRVEALSLAVRIVADLGSTVVEALPAVSAKDYIVTRPTARATPQSDPFSAAAERKKLYEEMTREAGIDEVRILKPLVGGYSNAHVDLCQLIKKNTPQTLQVLKLDETTVIQQEENGAKEARQFIPSAYRIDLMEAHYSKRTGRGLLRYSYAGGEIAPEALMPFLGYAERQPDVREVMKSLHVVYKEALGPLYQSKERVYDTLNNLLLFFESRRSNKFMASIQDGLKVLQEEGQVELPGGGVGQMLVRFPFQIVESPLFDSERTREAWGRMFPGVQVRYGHGDFNPRNLLMARRAGDGSYVPIVIDYHRLGGPVPLALDFARLEVGLIVKGLKVDIAAAVGDSRNAFVRLEAAINSEKAFRLAKEGKPLIENAPLPLGRAGGLVASIRSAFAEAMPDAVDEPRFYYATLMLCYLSYLRETYYTVLSPSQRSFSLYCACRIFERFFLP